MAVSANDGHPRLGESKLWPNHVHDPLFGGIYVEQTDAEFLAVALQRCYLTGGNRIGDGCSSRLSGNVMVNGCYGSLRAPYFPSGGAQAVKRLRGGDFMDQVEVDVENWRPTGRFAHQVGVPYFFK